MLSVAVGEGDKSGEVWRLCDDEDGIDEGGTGEISSADAPEGFGCSGVRRKAGPRARSARISRTTNRMPTSLVDPATVAPRSSSVAIVFVAFLFRCFTFHIRGKLWMRRLAHRSSSRAWSLMLGNYFLCQARTFNRRATRCECADRGRGGRHATVAEESRKGQGGCRRPGKEEAPGTICCSCNDRYGECRVAMTMMALVGVVVGVVAV